MPLTADLWRELGPRMDEALDLPPAQRTVWLAELALREPELAKTLTALLADHDAAAGEAFLDGPAEPQVRNLTFVDLTGARFGNYVLQSLVGQGGMGSVWLARRDDGRFEGRAAVKVLNAGVLSEAAALRFKREGTILARLGHPCIARLLDAGVSVSGLPYLVLEFVDGAPIDTYCNTRKLSVRGRVELFLSVLAAVEHSHTHLIVHRDIKPSNVLVSDSGEVKLLDFGIAKLIEEETLSAPSATTNATVTVQGGRAMTPQYAAPEQLQGLAVTTVTDVYSLGVLLYGLLTSCHPTGLRDATPAQFIHAIVEGDSLRASTAVSPRISISPQTLEQTAHERNTTPERLRKLLCGDIDNILAKALKRDPRERYGSVSAFAEDLRRFLAHLPVAAQPDALSYRAARFMRRNRAACAGAALTLCTLLGGLVSTAWQARVAADQAQRAAAVHAFMLDLFGASERQRARAVQVNDTSARELLDMAAQRIDDVPTSSLQARIDLLDTLASLYLGLGLDAAAVPLYDKQIALARRIAADTFSGDTTGVADALVKQAAAAQAAGLIDKRDAAYEEAQRVLAHQATPPVQLQARLQMVQYHRLVNSDAHAAAEAIDRAIDIFRRLDDQKQLMRALRLRGQVHARMGMFAPAEEALAEAFNILQRTDPNNHAIASTLLSVRGELLIYLNRIEAASRSFEQGVATAVLGRGEDHPATAFLRAQWSSALCLGGRLRECEAQAQMAVQTLERTVGDSDPRQLVEAVHEHGTSHLDLGLNEAAVQDFERALALHLRAVSTGVSASVMHTSVAEAQIELGALAQARQHLEAGRSLMMQAEGDKSWLATLALLDADVALAEDNPMLARAALQPVITGALGPSVQFLFEIESALTQARVALATDDPAAADLVAAARKRMSADDLLLQIPLMESRLLMIEGQLQLHLKQPRAAIAPLRRALELREARLHPDATRLADARVWLAQALMADGRMAEADQLLAQAQRAHAAHRLVAPQYVRPLQAALAQRTLALGTMPVGEEGATARSAASAVPASIR